MRLRASRLLLLTAATLISIGITHSALSGQSAKSASLRVHKTNQNRLFHYAGSWWSTSPELGSGSWWLSRRTPGAAENVVRLDQAAPRDLDMRPDLYMSERTGFLYVMLSHHSTPKFLRLRYEQGSWTIDAGFPVALPEFTDTDSNHVSLVVDANETVWLFRVHAPELQALTSSDSGRTWSDIHVLKTGLNSSNGITDAVLFSDNGRQKIGLAYAEQASPGSIYGFLVHDPNEADSIWTDETAPLAAVNPVQAHDVMMATADREGTVFIVTSANIYPDARLHPSGTVLHALFVRRNGSWERFPLFTLDVGGELWTELAVTVDATNRDLHLFGTGRNKWQGQGYHKFVSIGNEDLLQDMRSEKLFFDQSTNDDQRYEYHSVPMHTVTDSTGLLAMTHSPLAWRLLEIQKYSKPPRAIGAAMPDSGAAPLEVHIRGSGSVDHDGWIESYEWAPGDRSGDRTVADFQHTYINEGTYFPRLIVTDNEGQRDTTTVRIVVSAAIPSAVGEAPGAGPDVFTLSDAWQEGRRVYTNS